MSKEPVEKELTFKDYFVPLTTTKAIHFIILIGTLVYANNLFNGFVGDDLPQILYNSNVHSLQNFFSFFFKSTFFNGSTEQLGGVYYKPLLLVFFSSIYTVFGSSSFIFHLLQLFLYITNACLVYLVFTHYFRKSLSFGLALVFLVHPINSEVALYISDLQDTLFFFFGITSLLLLQKIKTRKRLLVIALLVLCSLFSKETGILFVFLLLMYAILYNRKFLSHLSLSLLSVVTVYALLRIIAVGFNAHSIDNTPIVGLDFISRLQNIPYIFSYYLSTFLYPNTLSVSHHYIVKEITFNNFYLPMLFDVFILFFFALFGLFLYTKNLIKYLNIYILFAFWFFIGISLHIQLIPLDQTVAERWFYFPIVGLLGMIGVALSVFRISFTNKLSIIILIVIIILLSTRSFIRTFDFRDNLILASHDVKVSPEAHDLENVLSATYFSMGDYEKAIHHAKRSIEIYPTVTNYTNLGAAYIKIKEFKKGKEAIYKGLTYRDYYAAYENLAALSLVYGNPKENIAFINEAVKKYPNSYQLWLYLAGLEYNYGNKVNAKEAIQEAYRLQPTKSIHQLYQTIMKDKELKLKI